MKLNLKLKVFELMDLYKEHLDIIDSIENNILLIENSKFYDLFSTYQDYLLIYNLNEEFINNAIKELKISSNNIINNIKNEIEESKNILKEVKINLSNKYKLNLGDIAHHLIKLVTVKDLQNLNNTFYNLLDSVLKTFNKRDKDNYDLLMAYLNKVKTTYLTD